MPVIETPDSDVIEIVDPLVQGWLRDIDATRDIVISRSMFERLSIPRIEMLHPTSRTWQPSGLRNTTEGSVVAGLLGGEHRATNALGKGNVLPWHTNSDAPGERLYLIYNETAGSVFRWLDPETGKIEQQEEPEGWTARRFTIPETGSLWHSIWSAGKRISVGYRLS